MFVPPVQRLSECAACGKPAAGNGDRCIFCGAGLLLETVNDWRIVYHPYSYADAMLATAALRANGVTTRFQHCNAERVLLGRAGGVVQVAADEQLAAREVLRLVRGVRTDPEYLEWQAVKRRRPRMLLLVVALAAGATITCGLLLHLLSAQPSASTTRHAAR